MRHTHYETAYDTFITPYHYAFYYVLLPLLFTPHIFFQTLFTYLPLTHTHTSQNTLPINTKKGQSSLFLGIL